MRIPLGVNLESRDGGVTKDARVVNGIVEVKGEGDLRVRKRPGFSDIGLVKSGTAQLLYAWNGLNTVQADYLNRGTIATIVSSPTSTSFAVSFYLNPSDKSADITLSNSNLTAASSASYRSVRGTTGKSAGKWYWEITSSGNDYFCGIGLSTASLASYVGVDANGFGLYGGNGNKYTSNTPTAFTTALSPNETVGYALDMDGGTLKVYRSGALVGTLASGLAGTYYPMLSPNGTQTVTINFGASPFTYPIPSGYSPMEPLVYTYGQSFTASDTGSNATTPRMMIKNRTNAWTVNQAGAISAVTYGGTMGLSTYSLISLTRSGTTATGTTASVIAFNVGDTVTIAGANETAYNGAVTVTAVTPGSTTPATTVSISSLTRSGTTATAVTATAHGLTNGNSYAISGANQSQYNISAAVTVIDTTTFTYTITLSAGSTTTWNPADKDTGVTLSNGDLTATINHGGTIRSAVRGTVGKSTGKWYWEVTATTVDIPVIGVGDSSMALTDYVGDDAHGWGYSSGGKKFHNDGGAGITVYGATWTSGDIIGVALDMDSGTITFYKNGVSQGQAFSGITGTIYPALSNSSSTTSTSVFTANFGATAFTYSIPAGFSPLYTDDPVSPASGTIIVTKPGVTTNSTFTYAVAGSPATPATGTITATLVGGTVPGIPYIDGYFCVMDVNGVIWNSNSDDPTTWGALNFITAQAVNGAGKSLSRSQNYLIALKEWSTEYFYDAHNGSGSPFSPVDNGFTLVGCAHGDSVAQVDGNLLWLSQVKERGRSVHMMTGLQMQPVSTPDIERILGADDLATVYAYGLKISGHPLYLLTLVTSGITLVYDLKSQVWSQWSSLTIGSSKSVSSITRSGTTATVTTATAHGLSDGDPVKISGANQNEYNTIFQARVISTTVFKIEVDGNPTTPATGTILAWPYTSSYFKFTKYVDYNGLNLFLHESDGHLYQMVTTLYQDAGVPIDLSMRTVRMDGGTTEIKTMSSVTIIGDKVVDDGVNNIMMIRYSDDDYTTNSSYRVVDLSLEQPQVRKLGGFRRRSMEARYTGNASPVLQAMELTVQGGQ